MHLHDETYKQRDHPQLLVLMHISVFGIDCSPTVLPYSDAVYCSCQLQQAVCWPGQHNVTMLGFLTPAWHNLVLVKQRFQQPIAYTYVAGGCMLCLHL